ncbi:LPXTG cell wall anchor domain-containing protein [Actinoplanes solisilvae]|uniref:LPXTG cell wall anchor domain-containing protein n=1 Tax=Actinoplanes solisilvae TaxID=2486853 RepID=UPI000FDBD8B4|nr:LPXTG cell wall anchor domain-containing protein [Actinoplanes solisilvae]
MSSIRRIVAVGLPVAGFTAALALGVSPALATEATVDQAARPVVAATGYGTPDATEPDATEPVTTTDDEAPTRGQGGYGTPTPAGESPDTDTPTRGNPGYAPSTPAPSVSVATVPTTTPGTAPATTAPGVKDATLPVTGSPMTAVMTAGGLLVAAGAASVWYTRRRRGA